MSSTPRTGLQRGRFLAFQLVLEAICIVCIVGLFLWVYTQGQTEHQICQAFTFFGDRTQQQIDINKAHFAVDMRKHDAAAVKLDRRAISDATSFLIRIRRVQC